MKSLRLVVVQLVTALVAVAVTVQVAAASGPTIERSTVQRSFDDFFVCDGFNIAGAFEVRRTRMWFFDADGNELRFVIHRDIEGTLTNSATGATFPYREHDTVTFYPDGSDTNTGNAAQVVVPGRGTIFLIAGRIDGDGVHGRFDEPLACAALS